MAEYGPEMEREYEEYADYEEEAAPQEEPDKLEVVPTDYAKRIAELDEDLRTAMEILVLNAVVTLRLNHFANTFRTFADNEEVDYS